MLESSGCWFTVWHHGLPQAQPGRARDGVSGEPCGQLDSKGALRTAAFSSSASWFFGQYQPLFRRQSLEPGHP